MAGVGFQPVVLHGSNTLRTIRCELTSASAPGLVRQWIGPTRPCYMPLVRVWPRLSFLFKLPLPVMLEYCQSGGRDWSELPLRTWCSIVGIFQNVGSEKTREAGTGKVHTRTAGRGASAGQLAWTCPQRVTALDLLAIGYIPNTRLGILPRVTDSKANCSLCTPSLLRCV